jgi:modulator of FtsH protease HflK
LVVSGQKSTHRLALLATDHSPLATIQVLIAMRTLTVFLILAASAYALSGVVQVSPGERAVVRRFGRVLEHKPEPGLWVGLPFGMDRVDRVAVDRVQSVMVGFREEGNDDPTPAGQLLTGDHNLVNTQATLYWKVRPDELEDYVVQADRVEELLARAAEAVLAEWIAGREVDDVLLNGKNALPPALIAGTQTRIDDYHLGVQVLDARVGMLAPPESVKHAFDSVASEQANVAALINEAEQEAESKLRVARSDKFRTEQETGAYVERQTLLAQREAERFGERLKQYEAGRRTNPAYLRQIWEEERGKLFAKLKENGQIGLLDHDLGPDGLDMTIAPALPKKQ